MKYVYTLKYCIEWEDKSGVVRYSFVSSATFEQALRSAMQVIRRQHPSEKLEVVSFSRKPGDEVPDDFETEDDYER